MEVKRSRSRFYVCVAECQSAPVGIWNLSPVGVFLYGFDKAASRWNRVELNRTKLQGWSSAIEFPFDIDLARPYVMWCGESAAVSSAIAQNLVRETPNDRVDVFFDRNFDILSELSVHWLIWYTGLWDYSLQFFISHNHNTADEYADVLRHCESLPGVFVDILGAVRTVAEEKFSAVARGIVLGDPADVQLELLSGLRAALRLNNEARLVGCVGLFERITSELGSLAIGVASDVPSVQLLGGGRFESFRCKLSAEVLNCCEREFPAGKAAVVLPPNVVETEIEQLVRVLESDNFLHNEVWLTVADWCIPFGKVDAPRSQIVFARDIRPICQIMGRAVEGVF